MELLVKEEMQVEGIQDEILTLEEFEEEPREESEIYVEPTTADLQNLIGRMFEDESPEPSESEQRDKMILKQMRADKMRSLEENSPYE
jgi:hypothetical protein